MEQNQFLDWKSVAKRHDLVDGFPCALVAFAACMPLEEHVQCFYKELMLNGLLARNEQGPPGGVSLVGMLKALKNWEGAVRAGEFRTKKLRGMDVHHITLKGSTIADFKVYPTDLRGKNVETIIIFIEGDGREGHFFSARRMWNGQYQAMERKAEQYKLLQELAQVPEPTSPSVKSTSTSQGKGPARAPTPPPRAAKT
jgi:hypothetical protein